MEDKLSLEDENHYLEELRKGRAVIAGGSPFDVNIVIEFRSYDDGVSKEDFVPVL